MGCSPLAAVPRPAPGAAGPWQQEDPAAGPCLALAPGGLFLLTMPIKNVL